MDFSFSGINWLAVGACVVLGQVISTLWFTAIFGEPWAREYGAADRKAHTSEVPGYTYGVQAACTIVMAISLAVLHRWLDISSIGDGVVLGLFASIGFIVVNVLPGQAFLRRWRVALLCFGCQSVMSIAMSIVLAAWR